mmetsp:Transcript_9933/g.14920  ORF Transcript_9933/g.14920 Transcript_9933/m.14920 type:complete len:85 (-) Transcript_9933:41-295(-)
MTLKPPLESTGLPLTLTLPDAMRSSASRLECVALNALFNRIPSSSLLAFDVLSLSLLDTASSRGCTSIRLVECVCVCVAAGANP